MKVTAENIVESVNNLIVNVDERLNELELRQSKSEAEIKKLSLETALITTLLETLGAAVKLLGQTVERIS